jgi:DNA polymerase
MLQPTFDIINCGPRHRFVANEKLVHNSQKTNLQNLGRKSNLRRALIAPKGKLVYVADSSNIEARMNNWNAGQDDMVQLFHDGADVYSLFAGENIYHRPINKDNDPVERFVGKVAVLGLGYGMGKLKFRTTLATGAMGMEVLIDEPEAYGIVQAYRAKHHKIVQYWNACDIALAKMINPHCDEPFGHLHLLHNMIVLPNGMALQYPGLRANEDQHGGLNFEYHNGQFWKNTWGGTLCISKDTPVLTDVGLVKIQDISSAHKVWDGVEWVHHNGLVNKGSAQTIKAHSVWMTPEHEVLTTHGWKPAHESTQYRRAHCELPKSFKLPLGQKPKSRMEHPVPGLQPRVPNGWHRIQQTAKKASPQLLRVYAKVFHQHSKHNTRDEQAPGVRGVAQHVGPVPTAQPSSLQKLRSPWNFCLQTVAHVRALLGRYAGWVQAWVNTGSERQRWGVPAGQLPMGKLPGTSKQPPQQQNPQRKNGSPSITRNRHWGDNAPLPNNEQLAGRPASDSAERRQQVYDILDCGPRNRFTVIDENGYPLIVHNCENIIQALARIVLFEQMLDINDYVKQHDPEGRVVLNVHDEIIVCASDFGAVKTGKQIKNEQGKLVDEWVNASEAHEFYLGIEHLLRQPLDWCPDLPLDCEGGFDLSYSK